MSPPGNPDEMAFAENMQKAKPDVSAILGKARWKSNQLKAKGWKPSDFVKVLLGGPQKQKEVHDEVQRRNTQNESTALDPEGAAIN